jgi:mannose/cellobiose epimerase-like protein (N-acyl-D-glucosamine 2-epimerase family)
MTDMGDARVPSIGTVISLHDELLGWLRDQALPLWNQHGVDRRGGGYFENLGFGADRHIEASGSVRRGRVVARQIYVFDLGQQLGWRTDLSSPVTHGCDYLFSRMHAGDGVFHTALDAATSVPNAPFSLYEQAFYLFALSRLSIAHADRYPVAETALRCLERLRREFGRAQGGFEESDPPSLPLKSNPHMHLLEAALAWIDVTDGAARRPWTDLAHELVGLCLTRFMDAQSGALREYFDHDWRPIQDDSGRIVEPGHQFEWAWLLLRWSSYPSLDESERRACVEAAKRLLDIGEKWGVDPVRGVAVNEIWDDLNIKDSAAKLWPQTERVKAWCAMLVAARSVADAEHASQRIAAAADGMAKYIRAESAGLWSEVLFADGTFESSPSKASSFYHVACAIDVLRQTVSAHRTSVLYLS